MRGQLIANPALRNTTPNIRDVKESRWLVLQRLILIGCSVAVLGSGALHLGYLAVKESEQPRTVTAHHVR